jgi:YD repeat-containing protein
MISKGWRVALALVCAYCSSTVAAQERVEAESEYANKIGKAQNMGRLDEGSFGENISLFNGQLSFSITDIAIPGNNGLPVTLSRKRTISERYLHQNAKPGGLAGFYDWDLDLPYLEGVFSARGWVVGSDNDPTRYQRCSLQKKPFVGESTPYPEDMIWNGYNLSLPGEGSEQLLVAAANVPMPADGQSYPWVTVGNARVRCLPQTQNGVPGEAFQVVTPQGVKYSLNWVVSREMPTYSYKDNPLAPTRYLSRSHVYFLATRAEDRFGNWVNYGYTGDKLTSISSSDGRSISIAYVGERISSATANGRTWTYQYREPGALGSRIDGGLAAVVLPDGARWTYTPTGTLRPPVFGPSPEGSECDPRMPGVQGPYIYTVMHPAGATATYTLNYRYFYRASDISPCSSSERAPYVAVWNLQQRSITGAGLPGMVTNYSYAGGFGPEGRWTTVTQPDSTTKSYRFGVRPRQDEGRLLETRTASANGTTLEGVSYEYLAKEQSVGQFVALVGQSLSVVTPTEGLIEPQRMATTTVETTQYVERVDRFDAFARPVDTYSGSEVGVAKDRTTYHDALGSWTLGQTALVADIDTGVERSRTEYTSQALPQKTWAFGKLDKTLTYDALGNLTQVTDGNGNVTQFEDYLRGTPRRIAYADGTSISAMVDTNGWLLSRTDETGAVTSFSYDSMGRLTLTRYPTGDSLAWNDTVISRQRTGATERGLAAGHWRETEATGNARRITYRDALLRPVLFEEYDATQRSSTLRQVINSYDYAGRVTFQSYPGRYRLGEP